jgi:hypothetical protein
VKCQEAEPDRYREQLIARNSSVSITRRPGAGRQDADINQSARIDEVKSKSRLFAPQVGTQIKVLYLPKMRWLLHTEARFCITVRMRKRKPIMVMSFVFCCQAVLLTWEPLCHARLAGAGVLSVLTRCHVSLGNERIHPFEQTSFHPNCLEPKALKCTTKSCCDAVKQRSAPTGTLGPGHILQPYCASPRRLLPRTVSLQATSILGTSPNSPPRTPYTSFPAGDEASAPSLLASLAWVKCHSGHESLRAKGKWVLAPVSESFSSAHGSHIGRIRQAGQGPKVSFDILSFPSKMFGISSMYNMQYMNPFLPNRSLHPTSGPYIPVLAFHHHQRRHGSSSTSSGNGLLAAS